MKKNNIKIITIFIILVSCVFLMECNNDTKPAENTIDARGNLIILQAYGNANGSSPAGVSHSFVELYNISDKVINLDGISLYFANGVRGADVTEDEAWKRITLSGKIPAKGSFLMVGAKHNDLSDTRYTIPDGYEDIYDNNVSLNRRGFKVALIEGTAQLTVQNPFNIDGKGTVVSGYIDMVGAANDPDNSNPDNIFGFETSPARCSASEAVRRANLLDTDINSVDFIAARYALTGNGAFTDEMLEVRRPRNSSAGSWNPFAEPEEPTPPEDQNKLLIWQVGAATDGAITRSFVELYNNTNSPINLNTYSIQYANTVGTSWTVINLTGTIPAKCSYLVVGPQGTITGDSRLYIDAADQTIDDFTLSNKNFKVALMANQTNLTVENPFSITGEHAEGYVDMLGAKNSGSDNIDAYETVIAQIISKQAAARRHSLADTDNNSVDFERIDYRTSGTTDADVDKYRPRNSGNGEWNPIAVDASAELTFSHNSGLYNQSFSLAITAPAGSAVYYSIDGSIPSPNKVDNRLVYKYSSPITVQNRNGQANILATEANITQMNMVQNDPRGSIPTFIIPNTAQVPKATVIRAVAVDANGKQSNVLTKTYFIGNNLADYANNRVISLVTDPYNLLDTTYGIMVRGTSNKRWPNYNFNMKGREWEREAYLELFEGNGNSRSVPLSTGVGIRVRGGWSRAPGQKSLNVYFREEYGMNNLRNYDLIPGAVKADGKTPVERYKNFTLRNGGNDMEYTKFYDVFIQNLVSDRSFTAQAAVPCVVYLNGEYWGPYNLQEKYSDNHTEYKYGVNNNNVISFDNGELDDGVAGDEKLFWQMMDFRNKDMKTQTNYNNFCAVFDIDNFIDYFAAQIYIYNQDWPQNNYRAWRVRTAEPGNPYGDTKWRWQMFDTEFAIGIYSGGRPTSSEGLNAFEKILDNKDSWAHNIQLFKALLANENFCRQFVNTMMDLYNVNFHPDFYISKLNSYATAYKPLMDGYYTRWGFPGAVQGIPGSGWTTVFQNKTDDAKKYLNDIRDVMVNDYLPRYFGGGAGSSGIANIGISRSKLFNVTLSTTGASGASIKINTVTPNLASGSWTGKYYSGNPITVTASAPPIGYEFDGWTIAGGSAVNLSAQTTSVNFTENVQITAKYKLN